MNSIEFIKSHIVDLVEELFGLDEKLLLPVEVKIEVDSKFGDLSCNAAMVLAKHLKMPPIEVANKIQQALTSDLVGEHENPLACHIEKVEVAGPGFLNIKLNAPTWHTTAHEFFAHPEKCLQLYPKDDHKKFLVEFVSANPTGPLSIAHGRNAIIGDVLCRVLDFLGHKVTREYYINDAGSQMDKIAASLKARCKELAGHQMTFPEDGYAGEYVVEHAEQILKEYCIAEECLKDCGCGTEDKPIEFFRELGRKRMLEAIKSDLKKYGVEFENWFSETSLHESGKVDQAVKELDEKGFLYEKDGGLWFKSTEFGDDKDRVIKKSDGDYTYIAPDIAYHKDKFERNFDVIIDVLGQDHHSYAKRLKATMKALGFDHEKLKIVLYQLVSMKYHGQTVRMSKRAGAFEALSDVVKNVGCDVARYFFLNKKPDAHLEFDLELAQTKDMNNPVYYLQYGYVRAKSVLEKALNDEAFQGYTKRLLEKDTDYISELSEAPGFHTFGQAEISILKKICTLRDILVTISRGYQTNLIASYAHELAAQFHSYYNSSKVLDPSKPEQSKSRLMIVKIVRNTLGVTLDLMGLSKPEKM